MLIAYQCKVIVWMSSSQGWVFAMAKSIFAGAVEKTSNNRQKPIFWSSGRLHYCNIISDKATNSELFCELIASINQFQFN